MRKVKINNKEYPFKFTLNAMISFEDEFEKSIIHAGSSVKENTAIVFFGLEAGAKLSGNDLDISRDQIGDIIDFKKLNEIVRIAISDLGGSDDDDPKQAAAEKASQ